MFKPSLTGLGLRFLNGPPVKMGSFRVGPHSTGPVSMLIQRGSRRQIQKDRVSWGDRDRGAGAADASIASNHQMWGERPGLDSVSLFRRNQLCPHYCGTRRRSDGSHSNRACENHTGEPIFMSSVTNNDD